MSDPQETSLLGTIASYATSKVYRFALRILTGFVRPLLLAPELFGLWNLFALILQYAEYYLHLGCLHASRFRLPRLWGEGKVEGGEGKAEEGERVKTAVFTGALVPHVLLSAALVGTAFLGTWETHVRWGLLTVAVVSLLLWYRRYLIHLLKARQNFRPVTRVNYITASIAFFLGTVLIYFFGIYGIFIAALVNEIALIAYLSRHCRERTAPGFDWPVYVSLIRQGFPIMAFDMASTLVRTADRLLIAALLGTEQLGYYALAAFIFTAVLEVPGASREVLEPRMMQEMSSGDPARILEDYFFRPLVNMAHYIPFLIGPAIFVLPFIDLVLPRYVAGVLPAQVLAVGGYFLAISFVARGVIVANGWQVPALVPVGATAVVNVALNVVAIREGFGIVGVAVASSLTFVLLLVLLLGMIKRRLPDKDVVWGPHLWALVRPFAMMAVLVGGLLWLAEVLAWNRWAAVAVQLVVFAVAMAVFIRLAHRFNPLVRPVDVAMIRTRLRRFVR